ncbi:hypothetical protein AURDEDRAFT_166633 [Auricularia subglabra TFB-10046 SS5]|nr:hypothetical protein AURDEDRAFT_166633 [Auricularia subglabra TFB-10046 SS5]
MTSPATAQAPPPGNGVHRKPHLTWPRARLDVDGDEDDEDDEDEDNVELLFAGGFKIVVHPSP